MFSSYHRLSEKEIIPLYELIFSNPNLKIYLKDINGDNILDLAKKNRMNIGVKYIENYIKKYNLIEN